MHPRCLITHVPVSGMRDAIRNNNSNNNNNNNNNNNHIDIPSLHCRNRSIDDEARLENNRSTIFR
jgi:hypothetical protein